MGRAARARLERCFTLERSARRTEELLEEAVANPAAPPLNEGPVAVET
jgi:hypothetical protein